MNPRNSHAAFGFAYATALAIGAISAPAGAAVTSLPVAPTAVAAPAVEPDVAVPVELAQYRRGYGPGPRAFAPGPRYVPGPRYYAPRRAYGGGWGYRPWYRRPYYGTIIGGIALGTIVGVTAYGLAPRPPRPDLCWFWADEAQSSGYWDYC